MASPKKPGGVTKRPAAAFNARTRAVAAQSLIGRARLMQRMAGVQYGGRRDIYQAAGYIPQDLEKFADYWGMYVRGDIAGRIVDMPARSTWRTPPEISEKDKPEGTPFTEAFNLLAKRLKLWHFFNRLDKLSGIGRYGVMMIGVKGVEDKDLVQPLLHVASADDLIYLAVYHEDNAQVQQWDMNTGSPRFGLPERYQLRIVTQNYEPKWTKNVALTVDHSRVIHAAEDVLQDDVFGRPRLQRVLNRLFDLDKVAASTGEAYWQLSQRILQAKIDPEADIDEPGLKALDEKLLEMVHDLRRQFTSQGVNLEWLSTQPPDPSATADMYFSLIAGATGIPKRVLFGSEMGELASSQDTAAYHGIINERQEQFAEPFILRAFIDRMLAIGALPEPESGEYTVTWPTLYEETELDLAAANLKRAETAKALTPVGGDPRELVEVDEDRNVWLVPKEPGPVEPAAAEAIEEDDDALVGGSAAGGDGGHEAGSDVHRVPPNTDGQQPEPGSRG